ncbi:DUF3160 domain-containing protein [Syntrophomonas erecta]
MQHKILRKISTPLVFLLISSLLGGCITQNNSDVGLKQSTGNISWSEGFAPYQEVVVDENPQLPPYAIWPDLGNVENASRFKFSAAAQEQLVKNGFVVLPDSIREFFIIYEVNCYDRIPNLVTTDSLLHNYHLFYEYLLKTVEEENLIPELKNLNQSMMTISEQQFKALKRTPWENAARRNLAFFTVGSCLLDPSVKVPVVVKDEVNAELKLIKEQLKVAISPVMNTGRKPHIIESWREDYTQYIPRGHYSRSEDLQSYFKNMTYYGRMSFRLKDEDETRSAVLMTMALQEEDNWESWEKVYSITNFFLGSSDEPGCNEYLALINQVYGPQVSLDVLVSNQMKWQNFWQELTRMKGLLANSIPMAGKYPSSRSGEGKGFRFMGQRHTMDADIFQQLIYGAVGENDKGQRRLLPRSIDIPAAFGSTAARVILNERGEYRYEGYSENLDRLNRYLSRLDEDNWHKNFYWNWMYNLRSLTREIPEGYPSFMKNRAWSRKELNTFLASWTELKHNTILYSKQVNVEIGGGGFDDFDSRGYVEPNPHLYARLAALSAQIREGLRERGVLTNQDGENLNWMENLALHLKTIAEKELKGELLTEDEYELIDSYGSQIEHLWLEALRGQGSGSRDQLLTDNPAMLVADVATDPLGRVLEAATGYVHEIYAVVPVEDSLRMVRGGVYSYYEFHWPFKDRLTDEKWRQMLAKEETPNPPFWTRSFTVEKGESRIIMPFELDQYR